MYFYRAMKTEIIEINTEKIDADKIKKAAKLIDEGNLVAFPTETVYGIACRVRDDSLKKLSVVKNRMADKYYTLHIDKKEKIKEFVPEIGLRGKKLISRAWPGPLTIVFELEQSEVEKQSQRTEKEVFYNLYKDDSIGIRCPDHPVASMLLSYTNYPVVAPSANPAGQPPATDVREVIRSLKGKIPLILDAGCCKYKKSSTVVKIGLSETTILREGVFSQKDIKEMSQIKFLFVCTGNSCRSPMAGGIFSKYLAEKLKCNIDQLEEMGYKIYTAGTMGIWGLPASAEAINACAAKGIDISNHVSTGLTEQLINKCDLIYVMTASHCRQVIEMVPQASEKCLMLTEADIPDPIGQEQQIYEQCADMIEKAVKERIRELKL
jgi:L-threonylcarbamoyladenylate synthase